MGSLGKTLREQYEPPKELPHRLFALLLELDKSEEGRARA
jgi:hypothetical protein